MADHSLSRLKRQLSDVISQNDPTYNCPRQRTMMLFEIADFACLEANMALWDDLFAAFPAIVHDFRVRQIHDLPARILDALLPIEFFGVHEERFVECAYLLNDLT